MYGRLEDNIRYILRVNKRGFISRDHYGMPSLSIDVLYIALLISQHLKLYLHAEHALINYLFVFMYTVLSFHVIAVCIFSAYPY
jgi:hypothetical protein